MYCTTCGQPRPDNATVCPSCSAVIRLPPPAPAVVVPNYLIQSVLVTLCCCLPFGIPAIVYAAQVNSKLAAGDIAGAREASKNARTWCWVSFGCGVIAAVVYFMMWLLGALHS